MHRRRRSSVCSSTAVARCTCAAGVTTSRSARCAPTTARSSTRSRWVRRCHSCGPRGRPSASSRPTASSTCSTPCSRMATSTRCWTRGRRPTSPPRSDPRRTRSACTPNATRRGSGSVPSPCSDASTPARSRRWRTSPATSCASRRGAASCSSTSPPPTPARSCTGSTGSAWSVIPSTPRTPSSRAPAAAGARPGSPTPRPTPGPSSKRLLATPVEQRPASVHVSGCEKGCARAQPAAVSFVATDPRRYDRYTAPASATPSAGRVLRGARRAGLPAVTVDEYLRDGAEIYRRRSPPSGPRPTSPGAARPRAGGGPDDPRLRDGRPRRRPRLVARRRRLGAGARCGDGAPILADSMMVANGVTRRRLPADNAVVCTLGDPGLADDGRERAARPAPPPPSTCWRDRLDGAVVAIGNAPTALFRLLELLDAGAPRPAAVHRRAGRVRRRGRVEGRASEPHDDRRTVAHRPRPAGRQRARGRRRQRPRRAAARMTDPASSRSLLRRRGRPRRPRAHDAEGRAPGVGVPRSSRTSAPSVRDSNARRVAGRPPARRPHRAAARVPGDDRAGRRSDVTRRS